LEDGPLLRCIGAEHDGDVLDYQLSINSELDIEPELGTEDLGERIAPELPVVQRPGLPTLPTSGPNAKYQESMTQSDLYTGKSYSVPAESIVSQGLHRAKDHLLLGSWSADPLPPDLPSPQELDSEISDGDSNLQASRLRIFPWNFQFEWRDGQLALDGEHISMQRPASSSAPSTSRTTDAEDKSVSSTIAHNDTEMNYAATCVREIATDTQLSGLLSEKLYETQERLIDALEYLFWSTHGPCRSKERTQPGGQRAKRVHYNTDGASRSQFNQESSKRQKNTNNLGNDEDEDENEDNPQNPSGRESVELDPRFACPFGKKITILSKYSCKVRLKTIDHVRYHLKKVHFPIYCSSCKMEFGDRAHASLHKHCLPRKNPKPDFMTVEQYTAIKSLPRNIRPEEKWKHIFKILFPNDLCPSPYYTEDQWDERQEDLDNWMRNMARDFAEAVRERDGITISQATLDYAIDVVIRRTMPRLGDDEFDTSEISNQPSLGKSTSTADAAQQHNNNLRQRAEEYINSNIDWAPRLPLFSGPGFPPESRDDASFPWQDPGTSLVSPYPWERDPLMQQTCSQPRGYSEGFSTNVDSSVNYTQLHTPLISGGSIGNTFVYDNQLSLQRNVYPEEYRFPASSSPAFPVGSFDLFNNAIDSGFTLAESHDGVNESGLTVL
jgi:hypothetical protein